jgi:hypothetical protein
MQADELNFSIQAAYGSLRLREELQEILAVHPNAKVLEDNVLIDESEEATL